MTQGIDYFRGRLRVNRHRLDDELELQADHMDRIGREVAQATRAEADARRSFERAEATIIREAMQDDGKLSHAKASSDAKLHRDWEKPWTVYQNAKQTLLEWESVQKSWYQRGFDLTALGELFAHQYFVVDSLGGKQEQAQTRSAQREATSSYFAQREERQAGRRARIDDGADAPIQRRRLNANPD